MTQTQYYFIVACLLQIVANTSSNKTADMLWALLSMACFTMSIVHQFKRKPFPSLDKHNL